MNVLEKSVAASSNERTNIAMYMYGNGVHEAMRMHQLPQVGHQAVLMEMRQLFKLNYKATVSRMLK